MKINPPDPGEFTGEFERKILKSCDNERQENMKGTDEVLQCLFKENRMQDVLRGVPQPRSHPMRKDILKKDHEVRSALGRVLN
ncbi:MAG: hypothetical protein HY922_17405 [Elusimicrobia bacterium]|nr:hypothetical protein [Elusimicrobiota bacterium]